MLRRRKEETPRGVAGSLLTRLLGRVPGVSGCVGEGSRPHSINKLIKLPPTSGSSRSTATTAMLTCGKFRNEKRASGNQRMFPG